MQIELAIIEDEYVEKPEQWVSHRRSKNYIAKIVGFSKTYGFERKFLPRVRVGRKTYFLKADFKEGEVYEIKCIYYTRSGKPNVRLEGFFKCVEITDEKVILKEITNEEVIKHVRKHYGETEKIVKLEKEIDKLKKKKEEWNREIRALEKVRKELQEDINKLLIRAKEVERVKKELKKRIIRLAKSLLLLGERKYGGVMYKNDNIQRLIKIKEKNDELQYVYVKGAYVVSQYDTEVPLSNLFHAYKVLLEEVREKKKELEKIQKELGISAQEKKRKGKS